MKTPLAMALAWASLAVLPAVAAAQARLDPVAGTVALYQFSEGNGTTATDSAGGHTATFAGMTPPAWTTGRDGGALDFSGPSAALTVNPPIVVGGAWTIQAWMLFPLADNGSAWRWIAATNGNNAHLCANFDVLGCYKSGIYGVGLNVETLSGWHLVSAVGQDGSTTIYLDGTQLDVMAAQVTSDIVYLGGESGWSNGGLIDAIRVMNVARTAEDILVDFNGVPVPPEAPTSLGQFGLDDAPIAPGGSVVETFVVKADLSGYAYLHHVEVEVKPAGAAFNGTGLLSGADVPDGPTSVTVSGAGMGPLHWRVRTVDSIGSSPWVSFGPAPTGTDVVVTNNAPPVSGATLPLLSSKGTVIEAGTILFDSEPVLFQSTVTDVNGDSLILQIEVQAAGTSFADQPTLQGSPVASGEVAECRVPLSPGLYSWQSRAIDSRGAASAWLPFGGGSPADLRVKSAGSFGGDVCGGSAGSGAAAAGAALAAMLALSAARRTS